MTKARGSFPHDEAVSKLLYLALRNIGEKMDHAPGRLEGCARFAIIYENRLPAS